MRPAAIRTWSSKKVVCYATLFALLIPGFAAFLKGDFDPAVEPTIDEHGYPKPIGYPLITAFSSLLFWYVLAVRYGWRALPVGVGRWVAFFVLGFAIRTAYLALRPESTPPAIGMSLQTDSLHVPKRWSPMLIPQIGSRHANLTTKWTPPGELHFQLEIEPFPSKFKAWSEVPFTISFFDTGGFEILGRDIHRGEISTVVDEEDRPISLSVNSSLQCTADVYRQISAWVIAWRF